VASKLVTDRQKSADSVVAAGETHAAEIAKALAPIVKRHLKKGEQPPDIEAVVRILCAELEAQKAGMVKADEAHETELADDPEARENRDKATAALYDELVELREMLVGAYGGTTTSKILSGSTPDDPVVLARFAGEVAGKLDTVKLPPSRIKGAKIDVAEHAISLRDKRSKLDTALKGVQLEVREAQVTLAKKTTAVTAYDATFTGAATVLTGLLLLADKSDLAAKVKPSTRRAGQTAADAGDPAAAPAEEPPTK